MTSRALVLGGGGVAGIAWETGVLSGLADEGVDLLEADVIIGTSAGSAVAAQITSGLSLEALFARQLLPPEQSGEISADLDMDALVALFSEGLGGARTPREIRAAIGHVALAAATVPEAPRRRVIEHRLPVHEWPARDIRIVVVDAETGEDLVWDRDSGVGLVDAVAASCAVPGVWPPVTVAGRRYVDGGVRSGTNVDLASGYEVVVVLAPVAETLGLGDRAVRAVADAVRARPETIVLGPDEASTAAIGTNALDPATRAPSARAGRAQGREQANAVAAVWRARAKG